MAGVVRGGQEPMLFSTDRDDGCEVLELHLAVSDPETVDELASYADGDEREQFALNALRIGVLALRQAHGRVDADLIQRETQRMLAALEGQLAAHTAQTHDKLSHSLKEYFDPTSGRFPERVQQLIKQDGELEQLLRRQIGGEDSQLCKTLLAHFGQQSPLMKLLNPHESEGLLHALRQTLEAQLTNQRDHVLREFSLDNKEGALARMIAELTTSHGQLTEALEKKIGVVIEEFSLDKEDSALNRLVRNVDRAQTTITREFSLDAEDSALARLRRELLSLLDTQTKTNTLFQEEVKVALGKMAARREEAQRSTQHGLAFEDAVCGYLEHHAQQTGDMAVRTGHTTGLIKNSKVGDCVIELGPDSAAPGAAGGRGQRAGRLHAGQGPRRNRDGPQESRRAGRAVRFFGDVRPGMSRRRQPLGGRRVRRLEPRGSGHGFTSESWSDAGPGTVHSRRTRGANHAPPISRRSTDRFSKLKNRHRPWAT